MEVKFEFIDFLKVFAFGLLLYLFFALSLDYFQVPTLIESLHPSVSFTLNYFLQIVILFLPLYLLVIRKYKANLADFGFKKVKLSKLFSTVFLSYVFYIIVSIIISNYLFQNNLEIPGYEPQESHIPLFGEDLIGLLIAPFFIIIIAPFLEEIFFRGFIYRTLTKIWPIWLSSIIGAALFALFHFEFQSIIPLFFLGLILNYNYQRTNSLWTSVAFHALNNAIAFAFEVYIYYNPEALNSLTTGFTKLLPW